MNTCPAPRSLALLLLLSLSLPTSVAMASEPRAWSTIQPLEPVYYLNDDGSVLLQLCYDWSCARRKVVSFSPREMRQVRTQMAFCPGSALHDRIQRMRLGIWQMELLAESKVPVLANDAAINLHDRELSGRTDCIDNATNSRTYAEVLIALGELPGWSTAAPEVRDPLDPQNIHWTAVVIDERGGETWSLDSWYRPNGHLPFVLPLDDWRARQFGWQPPFDRLNPFPARSDALCLEPDVESAGLPVSRTGRGS